ncbi:hypothetical protein ACGFS9_31955 [Streptomyces sp. NPDC048566]|uniref:hypothetical protein n=1 Tax=Streptomyces sp. NPDC048566 TaxID=3365569 RepID=UPI0037194102
MTGYPAGWSVAAARAAITTATTALLPLLGDSDPTVRVDAAYVLATAADPAHTIRTALASGFATEGDAMARAALLLAAAEITRAHPHPPALPLLDDLRLERARHVTRDLAPLRSSLSGGPVRTLGDACSGKGRPGR